MEMWNVLCTLTVLNYISLNHILNEVNKENLMKNTVNINEFVRRQVKGSGKTYSDELTFEEIAAHAQEQHLQGNFREGYRNGVILINTDDIISKKFICPLVKITDDTKLSAKLVRRRDEEEPYIQIRAKGGIPLKTKTVELILYRNDVLKETNENSTDSEWELIAFQAIPEEIEDMPMGPITMMRNQLELKGGTKGNYSSKEWAESVRFWQEYAIGE